MKFALNRSLVWCGILSAILSSPHLVVRAADPATTDPIGAKQEPTETVTFDAKLPSTQLAPVYGANRTKVEVIKRPEIEYPENMRKWGNIGEGLMDVTIDENGKPRDLVVLESSHPAFELAMVRGILGGQYKPATVDGKPVATRVRFPLRFRLADQTDDRKLQARLPFSFTTDDAAGVAADFTYDQPPVIRVVAPAVYPRELLQKWISGKATIIYTLDKKGMVQSSVVASASHPEFGAAAKAMIAAWEFSPAKKGGVPVAATFKINQEFDREARDVSVNEGTIRLLKMLNSNETDIAEIGELDTRPRILYQTKPAIATKSLTELASENIVIEFFIDPDGGVQLPRIVSANNPDLGWAAASAVKRWVFETPKKNGKPVFARHQLKFDMR